MDQPNYFAIIPANVRYDEELKPNAKLLYGELTALCNRDGFCWAGNDYFAGLYKVDNKTISRWISQLVNGNYITTEVMKSEGNKRKIYLSNSSVNLVTKKSIPSDKKINRLVIKKSIASDEKGTSNIRFNNTINKTENKEETALAFFENNYPIRFEELIMKYRKQITDFEKFENLFEATVMQENLVFERNVLEGRFIKFAINWISNQDKFDGKVIDLKANQNNQPKRKFFKG